MIGHLGGGENVKVLLKLSGEALSGEGKKGYDDEMARHVAEEIGSLVEEGHMVGVVVGAGNLIRGKDLKGMRTVMADQIGMLATVMNAIYLKEVLENHGIPALVFSSITDLPSVKRLEYGEVENALKSGRVVIFGGGTSNPLFTTDTAAALRAAEMGAKLLLKATKVDGVYDSDPKLNPNAKKFERLTFSQVIEMDLKVMDLEAFEICRRLGIEIVVFDFFVKGNTLRAVRGEVGTRIS